MAWKGTELIIRIAADLRKYRDGLRDVASETRQQMGDAARATDGLTNAHKALEGQAGRAAQQLLQAGRAASNGDMARAGMDAAELAGGMGRVTVAAGAMTAAVAAAALVLGAYAVASIKAQIEHERQANLLALTGNAAGLVSGEMNKMARSVAESGNTTVGAAREITEALVSTGKIGRPALESMGTAIALVARASGDTEESVTADFKKMADGVTKWAVEHNERYHFLTVDQYRYIKSLEDAGRQQEAMRATTDALNSHLSGINENVGFAVGLWRSLTKAINSAWEAFLNWGRADTISEQISAAEEKVKSLTSSNPATGNGWGAAQARKRLSDAVAQLETLKETARLERRSADAKAASAAATVAQIAKEEEASKAKAKNAGSTKRLTDAEREAAKAAKELAQTRAAAQAMTDRAGEAHAKSADAVMASNQALREEIALIGASASERVALAQAKEEEIVASLELDLINARNSEASATTITNLEREIALRRERVALLGRKGDRENAYAIEQETTAAMREVGRRADTEWDRTSAHLADAVADGLMAGFDSSEGFAKGFADYLGKLLKRSLAQELASGLKGAIQSALTGNSSGMNNSLIGAAIQYYTGGAAGASTASLAYANMVGAGGGDSLGALITANGGWAGVSTGGTSSAGGAAAAGSGTSLAAYAGYAALIYAAVQYADKLYGEGYNRNMLGLGTSQRYTFGTGNRTSGYTDNAGYSGSRYDTQRKILDGLGMSEKWADILSGTTRYAHMFARKLNSYGYAVNIEGGTVSVGGYESYRAGWAGRALGRGKKEFAVDIDQRDAQSVQQQVKALQEGTRLMAQALGYSAEAVDNYTGKLRVNFKGANTAAEQAQRMAEAMDQLQYEMMKAAAGGKYSREEFGRMMQSVRADLEAAGISASGIADILVQGMTGRLSQADVGDQLAEMIVGGIYNSIAGNYAGMIAQAFTTQIITPLFVAMAAGVPISQAISQAAINNVVATAQQAAQTLNAVFNDAGFRQAIGMVSEAIKGVSIAATSVRVPSFGGASAAATAAAQKRQQIEQERFGLESQLLTLLGDTTRLRARELAGLNASNRVLQQRVWLIEDAKEGMQTAFDALRRAVDAQRNLLTEQLQAAQDAESVLSDVFGTLRDNIRALRGEVDSTTQMSADQGRRTILAMLAGEVAITGDAVREAVDAVRDGVDAAVYGSAVDRDRARLLAANQFAALQGMVEPQLSAAEASVVALETQITQLDAQLKAAEDQMNALLGIDASVKSIADAVASLNAAMAAYSSAVSSAVNTAFMASAPSTSSASSGGGSGVRGAGGSSGQWTAAGYWAKNADLRSYYTANASWLNAQFGGRDQYLQWHWNNNGKADRRRFAKGGAFTNGVVTAPTFFDMGQMGEAGKEAVVPLANVGGSLGVRAITGGDEQTKALLRELINEVKASRSEGQATALHTSRMKDAIERVTGKGNSVAVHTLAGKPLATKETA